MKEGPFGTLVYTVKQMKVSGHLGLTPGGLLGFGQEEAKWVGTGAGICLVSDAPTLGEGVVAVTHRARAGTVSWRYLSEG